MPPITAVGFDGTMDESAFSRLMVPATIGDVVMSRNDFVTSAVSNARSVRVGTGKAYSAGLLIESTDTPTIAIPSAPSAGQWWLLVLRRNWDTNVVEPKFLAHSTTPATAPENPPTSFPSAFTRNPGVLYDQPLYWAWVVTGQTAVQLIDLRNLPFQDLSGTAAQRTTYYGATPSFIAARRALQGSRWYNTDTALNEVYMAAYDASSNPGGVQSAPAGWFSVGANGDVEVLNTETAAAVDVPGNKTTVVQRSSITLSQGRLLHARHYVRWFAANNTALWAYAYVNGVLVAKQRVHSNGGGVRYSPIELEYDYWFPAGTYNVEVRFDSDSASGTSRVDSCSTLVTGAGIS